MAEIYGLDAYAPAEVARRVQSVGVTKARLPVRQTLMLGVLAGAFIGLGSVFFTLVKSDASLGFATAQVLGGVVFALGLLLVVVAGAELFTGNNLLAMAWAAGQISTTEVLRNWVLVCAANFVGAAGLALLVFLSGHWQMNGGAIGRQVVAIALAKQDLAPWTAFFRGVLCNVLVCLAVWMAMAGRSVTDKVLAIIFPVSAFVAAGVLAARVQGADRVVIFVLRDRSFMTQTGISNDVTAIVSKRRTDCDRDVIGAAIDRRAFRRREAAVHDAADFVVIVVLVHAVLAINTNALEFPVHLEVDNTGNSVRTIG